MSKLSVIATMRAQPGKEQELEERLRALIAPTRSEPGCLRYDLHRQQDDPSVFVFLEEWADRDEFDKHLKMPYLVDFAAAAPGLLRGSLEIQSLDMLSSPKA